MFHNAGTANGAINFNRRVATLPAAGNFNSLYLDSARDLLYVGDLSNGVRVYQNASTADESQGPAILPVRTIVPTGFSASFVRDIAVDTTRNILYVAVATTAPSAGMSVLVFDNASALNNSVPPDRTLSISAGSSGSMGLAVDAAGDRLYVADASGDVFVFEGAHLKNDPQLADKTIVLPSTVTRLALDAAGDRLYAVGSTAIYNVPGVSSASGAVIATAGLAGSGGNFTAVAVRH